MYILPPEVGEYTYPEKKHIKKIPSYLQARVCTLGSQDTSFPRGLYPATKRDLKFLGQVVPDILCLKVTDSWLF